MFYIIHRLVFIVLIIKSVIIKGHRNERALIHPQNTIIQVSVGVATPCLIPDRSVFLNLVLQANYYDTTNATDYHKLFTTPIFEGRSDNSNHHQDLSAETFYNNMASTLFEFGMNGKQCICKTICQLAQTPLENYEDDVLAEVLSLILTPSGHEQYVGDTFPKSEYLQAEQRGLAGEDCVVVYAECPESILDEFTEIASEY